MAPVFSYIPHRKLAKGSGTTGKWVPKKASDRSDVIMLGLRNISGAQGGIETHVAHLSKNLAEQGLSVEAFIRSPYSELGSTLVDPGIRLRTIWAPRSERLETLVHTFLGVLYAARARPRILHIHAIGPALWVPLARLFGLRVVVTHHGQDFRREKWGYLARTLLKLGEISTAYASNGRIAVSRSLAKDLTAYYRKPFDYIPNGVPVAELASGTSALEAFGLKPRDYILTVGRLVPEKRHFDLIEAYSRMPEPRPKLVIVGGADHKSGHEERVRLLAARTPGVVMTGQQRGLALAELFTHGGLFVLPSSHEGLPIALLEAMSYGLPVLASDIKANLGVGLPPACYFPLSDLNALTQAFTSHFPTDIRVDWTAELEEFSWTTVASKTQKVYDAAKST